MLGQHERVSNCVNFSIPLKIVFGWDSSFETLVEEGLIEPLKVRRELAALERLQTKKVIASPRFGPERFKEVNRCREVRSTTCDKYVEPQYGTEREKNNPLEGMARILNDLHIELRALSAHSS